MARGPSASPRRAREGPLGSGHGARGVGGHSPGAALKQRRHGRPTATATWAPLPWPRSCCWRSGCAASRRGPAGPRTPASRSASSSSVWTTSTSSASATRPSPSASWCRVLGPGRGAHLLLHWKRGRRVGLRQQLGLRRGAGGRAGGSTGLRGGAGGAGGSRSTATTGSRCRSVRSPRSAGTRSC
ncbi:DPP7 isoform 2 [Pan troglodytes]|uniref:DPP7 isoform 2 n=1 Tax=Pan troglodytes TaxID=9598 RepID=A0A2J8N9L6_PANTR|nr:DPP7 isoform 2 [Pan troglodytes]